MNKEEIEYMFETLTKQWGDTDNYVNDLLSYSKNLQQENQELKKQLENCFCNRTDCAGRIKGSKTYYSLEQKIENQQKEFIKWLENYLELFDYDNIDEQVGYDMIEEILKKYKSITGVSDETN